MPALGLVQASAPTLPAYLVSTGEAGPPGLLSEEEASFNTETGTRVAMGVIGSLLGLGAILGGIFWYLRHNPSARARICGGLGTATGEVCLVRSQIVTSVLSCAAMPLLELMEMA